MFRKRYYLTWLSRKRSPWPTTDPARSRINPLPLLSPLSTQLARSNKKPGREFQTAHLHPPTTFREERAKPLDQSNLVLTHFHSQGLPLQVSAQGRRGRKENNSTPQCWEEGEPACRAPLKGCGRGVPEAWEPLLCRDTR